MNRQDLENQLAELEGGPSDEKATKGSIFEPLPKNWKPEPRIQPQHQPGSDPATFKIGDRDPRYGHRQAIAGFRYPAPGELTTRELEREELDYWLVWEKSSSFLESCIRYRSYDLQSRESGLSDHKELRAERWNFLLDLWAAHGITPPTDEQMEEWAEEYLAEQKSKSTSQSEREPG